MKRTFIFSLSLLSIVILSCNPVPPATINKDFLNGSWTYRSFINNPIDSVSFDSLELAVAIMKLEVKENDSITGILDMGEYGNLTMRGKITAHQSDILQFTLEGDGIPGTSTQGWIYNYFGYAVPKWSNGVDQVPACVGSLIRSVAHGTSKAGAVYSYYMVKR